MWFIFYTQVQMVRAEREPHAAAPKKTPQRSARFQHSTFPVIVKQGSGRGISKATSATTRSKEGVVQKAGLAFPIVLEKLVSFQ